MSKDICWKAIGAVWWKSLTKEFGPLEFIATDPLGMGKLKMNDDKFDAEYDRLFGANPTIAKLTGAEMKDDSLNDTQPFRFVGIEEMSPKLIEKFVSSEQSVYAKEVWNAAIEAAAKEAEGQEYGHEGAFEIRKLKK